MYRFSQDLDRLRHYFKHPAIFSEEAAVLRTFHIRTHRQADLLFAKECDE